MVLVKDMISLLKSWDSKLNKVSFVIISFIVIAIFISCGEKSHYRINYILPNQSLNRFDKDFSDDIQSTKIFVENLVNSYNSFLIEYVDPDFRDRFELAKEDHVAARVIFSSVAEAYIHIYAAKRNELIVDCTIYPIQLVLISGLDNEENFTSLSIPYEDALEYYDSLTAKYTFSKDSITFSLSGLTYELDTPKLIGFSRNSIAILSNLTFRFPVSFDTVRTFVDGIGILTGEREFSWATGIASEIGQELAIHEIYTNFFKLELFRKAMAHDDLKHMAQAMIDREKDPARAYPLWEFEKDLSELKEKARISGIQDTSYAGNLLEYIGIRQVTGTLLWYYSSLRAFMWQWILINSFWLAIIILFFWMRRWLTFLRILLSNWFLATLIAGTNWWVFFEIRPESLTLKFWIIPGILFLIDIIFLAWPMKKREPL